MRPLLALLLVLVGTGCASMSPFDQALREVRHTYPEARPQLALQLDLGYLTRGLALTALAWSDRTDDDVQMVRGLVRTMRSAQIRRYTLAGLDSATFAARRFRYAPPGWETLVRVRSDGDRVWVMGRPSTNRRTGTVMVGVFSQHELLLVKVNGRYERLVEQVAERQARRQARGQQTAVRD